MVGKPHILVVEDEVYLRDIYVEVLRDANYEVIEAETGEKAWALIQKETFDLILLDIMLPGIDGYEVLLKMQKVPSLRRSKVVLMTNLASDSLELPEKVKLTGIVVKAEMNPGEFLEKVKTYLA